MSNRIITGLYRTKKYGKWKPFSVGVADVELEEHELKKRVLFQIKKSPNYWNEEEGVNIVELKIES